jgi:hypothetical protein
MGALFTMPTLLKRVTALMDRISITARSPSRHGRIMLEDILKN